MSHSAQHTWDDSFILRVFDDAITSHRVRNGGGKKISQVSSSGVRVGEPGPWIPIVDTSAPRQAIAGSEETQRPKTFSETLNNSSPGNQSQYFAKTATAAGGDGGRGEGQQQQGPGEMGGKVEGAPSAAVMEEALNDMLAAWYQSGFASGRYYTLLELSQQRQVEDIGVPK